MNSVIMQGRLTAEPVLRFTINNQPVASFSIAVPKRIKVEGKPTADFFDCTAWDADAENIHRFFRQGDMILVRGRLENNNYTNREGVQMKGQVIVVEEWTFGPKKRQE